MKKGTLKPFWEIRQVRIRLNGMKKDSVVMDVGSGLPTTCFELESLFSFNKFICFDFAKTEKELIDYKVYYYVPESQKNETLSLTTFAKCRSDFFRRREKKPKGEFESKYNIHLGFDIATENIDDKLRCDLLLLMNVLHFLPISKGQQILEKFLPLLSNEGLIVLWLNHYQNSSLTNNEHSDKVGFRSYTDKKFKETCYLYDERQFMNLVRVCKKYNLKTIFEPTKFMESSNRISSMMYVGQLKNSS